VEPDLIAALFSAETGFEFAELLSLLGGQLNPYLVRRVKREIHRRILEPFLDYAWHWEALRMNWSAVCAGFVGMAALSARGRCAAFSVAHTCVCRHGDLL